MMEIRKQNYSKNQTEWTGSNFLEEKANGLEGRKPYKITDFCE